MKARKKEKEQEKENEHKKQKKEASKGFFPRRLEFFLRIVTSNGEAMETKQIRMWAPEKRKKETRKERKKETTEKKKQTFFLKKWPKRQTTEECSLLPGEYWGGALECVVFFGAKCFFRMWLFLGKLGEPPCEPQGGFPFSLRRGQTTSTVPRENGEPTCEGLRGTCEVIARDWILRKRDNYL